MGAGISPVIVTTPGFLVFPACIDLVAQRTRRAVAVSDTDSSVLIVPRKSDIYDDRAAVADAPTA